MKPTLSTSSFNDLGFNGSMEGDSHSTFQSQSQSHSQNAMHPQNIVTDTFYYSTNNNCKTVPTTPIKYYTPLKIPIFHAPQREYSNRPLRWDHEALHGFPTWGYSSAMSAIHRPIPHYQGQYYGKPQQQVTRDASMEEGSASSGVDRSNSTGSMKWASPFNSSHYCMAGDRGDALLYSTHPMKRYSKYQLHPSASLSSLSSSMAELNEMSVSGRAPSLLSNTSVSASSSQIFAHTSATSSSSSAAVKQKSGSMVSSLLLEDQPQNSFYSTDPSDVFHSDILSATSSLSSLPNMSVSAMQKDDLFDSASSASSTSIQSIMGLGKDAFAALGQNDPLTVNPKQTLHPDYIKLPVQQPRPQQLQQQSQPLLQLPFSRLPQSSFLQQITKTYTLQQRAKQLQHQQLQQLQRKNGICVDTRDVFGRDVSPMTNAMAQVQHGLSVQGGEVMRTKRKYVRRKPKKSELRALEEERKERVRKELLEQELARAQQIQQQLQQQRQEMQKVSEELSKMPKKRGRKRRADSQIESEAQDQDDLNIIMEEQQEQPPVKKRRGGRPKRVIAEAAEPDQLALPHLQKASGHISIAAPPAPVVAVEVKPKRTYRKRQSQTEVIYPFKGAMEALPTPLCTKASKISYLGSIMDDCGVANLTIRNEAVSDKELREHGVSVESVKRGDTSLFNPVVHLTEILDEAGRGLEVKNQVREYVLQKKENAALTEMKEDVAPTKVSEKMVTKRKNNRKALQVEEDHYDEEDDDDEEDDEDDEMETDDEEAENAGDNEGSGDEEDEEDDEDDEEEEDDEDEDEEL